MVFVISALYGEKTNKYYAYQRREMFPFVPTDVHELLEVGCGEAHFAAALKADRAVHVTAIEPFAAAAEVARGRVDRLLETDVEHGFAQLPDASFDGVVFNDVLEHLVDPWWALVETKRLLRPDGCVVASLPNMRYMPVLKDLVLNGDWEYCDAGVMDRTHLRFFTRRSIARLFGATGYGVERLEGINGIAFPWKFGLLNRLTGGALDDTRYVQFACVARPLPVGP